MRSVFLRPLALLGIAASLAGCHHADDGEELPKEDLPAIVDDMSAVTPHDFAGQGSFDFYAPLVVMPTDSIVTVHVGQALPTVAFSATLAGNVVPATWLFDRGELGSFDANGVFTPSGNLGGTGTVTAIAGSEQTTTTLTVQLLDIANGDPAYTGSPIVVGAGGYGGVGGDGPAGPASTQQQTTLASAPTADATVELLYPYANTLWPRGLLAPLLQWAPGTHHFDSLSVHIEETSFEYEGTFATNNANGFVNLPLPQQVWDQLCYSADKTPVTVTLVFGEGTTAYGPITTTWDVAPATLKGTVYYNSYGTYLVTNYHDSGKSFGAATLSIKPGATAPTVIAGTNSSDNSACRVCHSVSLNGKTLATQQGGNYDYTSLYDLLAPDVNASEQAFSKATGGPYPGLYPDGSKAFSNSAPFISLASTDAKSTLYDLPAGTPSTGVSGLPSGLRAGLPAFSYDGTHVAFEFYGGTGSDGISLASLDFDTSTNTFSNLQTLFTDPGGHPVAWPTYLPGNVGVVFELELAKSTDNTDYYGETRSGAQGELWWVDTATKTPHRLDNLNGTAGLPTSSNHPSDQVLNYEPTVSPIASGGYAWVVFTSRRIYGNVATQDPYLSDPRDYDATTAITTKKLWVSAIDLDAAPGTDPSHPPFYLPAQEIHAGNARGYWTFDPCHVDGTSCVTGDECCGGYCEPGGDGGTVCTAEQPTCAAEFEKCTIDSDCCNPPGTSQFSCINEVCSQQSSPIL